jgi:hypothetical protein
MAQSAVFLDDDRLLLGLGEGWYDTNGDEIQSQSGKQVLNTLAVWRIGDLSYQRVTHLERQTGTLLPLSDDLIIDLFEYPKVMQLSDGRVLEQWPDIKSGKQASCIIREQHPPPIAFDAHLRRLAVHGVDGIHVLSANAVQGGYWGVNGWRRL